MPGSEQSGLSRLPVVSRPAPGPARCFRWPGRIGGFPRALCPLRPPAAGQGGATGLLRTGETGRPGIGRAGNPVPDFRRRSIARVHRQHKPAHVPDCVERLALFHAIECRQRSGARSGPGRQGEPDEEIRYRQAMPCGPLPDAVHSSSVAAGGTEAAVAAMLGDLKGLRFGHIEDLPADGGSVTLSGRQRRAAARTGAGIMIDDVVGRRGPLQSGSLVARLAAAGPVGRAAPAPCGATINLRLPRQSG